ncbi:hypothetical protein [Paenibacillus sp. GP183]|uniref:hypothetical protein n=1 Tax=Paenibacillus sp. GP183 TaxID=1882751 RepID=UPI00089A148A|nr:hypothetical protein [Paenibacillus sp. GP183]SEB41295.1 hypothetical protein SAMN05443246_0132 [Paenibacillus sp. GP183]
MFYEESDWDKEQSEKLKRDARFKGHVIIGSEEEFAEEIAVPSVDKSANLSRSKRIGYAALILALLSMFIWPVILGPAAIILGFMAYSGGKRGLGSWSIALGLLSFAAYFLLMRMHS